MRYESFHNTKQDCANWLIQYQVKVVNYCGKSYF